MFASAPSLPPFFTGLPSSNRCGLDETGRQKENDSNLLAPSQDSRGLSLFFCGCDKSSTKETHRRKSLIRFTILEGGAEAAKPQQWLRAHFLRIAKAL